MHLSQISLFAAAIFGGAVVAQDFSKVPNCAIQPALLAIGKTGCGQSDVKCLCNSKAHIPELEAGVRKACSVDDYEKAKVFAVDMCKKAGVDIQM